MTIYTSAPEVEVVAKKLIRRWHKHLVDQTMDHTGIEVRCIFRDEHQTRADKAVLATTRLLGGLQAWLAATVKPTDAEAPRLFLIEVARDVWDVLEPSARDALIDHELCHCVMDDHSPPRPHLLGHDVEEFEAVVRRHGVWRPEVEALVKAGLDGGQLRLVVEAEP